MLDSTPVLRPTSTGSGGSRFPRFREHLSELEDTSLYPGPNTPPAPSYKRLSRWSTATDRDNVTSGERAETYNNAR